MTRTSAILRAFLFMVFFAVGLATLVVSMLAGELLDQYIARGQLKRIEKTIARTETLITDYDVVLQQLETNPDITDRLARVTLGAKPESNQIAYPKSTEKYRQAAKNVLLESFSKDEDEDEQIVPDWVIRCCRPLPRVILFLAGGGLVIISFACFAAGTNGKGLRN